MDDRLNESDPLDDFERRHIDLLGKKKLVYVTGKGPAVIVMSEMPGINPYTARFARFARWVREAGFTVYMPHLFGRDGAAVTASGVLKSFAGTCISREFRAFSANTSSSVTRWLRALASMAHLECGGRGVGAIGMCFTGNFALAMMLEKSVLAPVLAQPSLPIRNPAGLHISSQELALVKERMIAEDLTVLAYRFEGDTLCPAARFAAYEAALGDRFLGRTLSDAAANPASPMKRPHAVVTYHMIDEAGQPTRGALDEILSFFAARLMEPQEQTRRDASGCAGEGH